MAEAVQKALEEIYASLRNNNEGIDEKIVVLKTALDAAGEKRVTVDKTKLAQNDRPGRRLMQSYFKKRGVIVEFSE